MLSSTALRKVLLIGLLILMITSQAGSVSAGTDVRTNLGPEAGNIPVLVIDSTTPSTLYAGTSGGGFKSTNRGGVWNTVQSGLPSTLDSTLSINPALVWNTFLGGNGTGRTVVVDGSGNIYVTGLSDSSWGNPIHAYTGGSDGFVAKLDTSGALVWNTFLGGSTDDSCSGIAVDSNGNVYIAGYSLNTWGNPVRAFTASVDDAFVAKLDASGALVWNTFLGGGGYDIGHQIFVDGNDNIYVTGNSSDTWGSPVRAHSDLNDAFVAKLDTSGVLVWDTFLGGNGTDMGEDIVVAGNGNIYVAGRGNATWGNPVQAYTGYDVFVAKLNINGSLVWNTFLGGAGYAWGYPPAIAVDDNENIYMTGFSNASWGIPLRTYSGGEDAFVAKLDSTGSLTWNTFLGGSGDESTFGISLDNNGFIYVSGYSSATWGNPILAYSSGYDAFAVKLDTDGSLSMNLFVGGSGDDFAEDIVVDHIGNIILAGESNASWGSPILPFIASDYSAFVAKISEPGFPIYKIYLPLVIR